jgi:hypothetical protein
VDQDQAEVLQPSVALITESPAACCSEANYLGFPVLGQQGILAISCQLFPALFL